MNRIVTTILITLSILLSFHLTPSAALASDSQQDGYTLSAEALAAAKRFSSNPQQRTSADLELILKELSKPGDPASAPKEEYQAISRQQLIDLLGAPMHEGEDGWIMYAHTYGTTSFYFENDRLKKALTLWEPNYWYSTPRQSVVKRAWYKAVRWSRKFKKLCFR